MENQTGVAKTQQQLTKQFFSQENVKTRFNELLGQKSQGFIASVLQCVMSSKALIEADTNSIYQAAMIAATLDLPINQNLGFAYIIGYKDHKTGITLAQFQMGYKGYIQLAQRSGQFKTISAAPIYEGQLISENPLLGFEFDFTAKASDKIIGFASYFKLLNGFEKTLFMSADQMLKHGKRFSQTFKKGYGLWNDDPDSMGLKTVIKLLLSKFAPLSIEMQKAVNVDQSIINDADTEDITYIDNTDDFKTGAVNSEMEKLINEINNATTKKELKALGTIPDALLDLFNQKSTEVK